MSSTLTSSRPACLHQLIICGRNRHPRSATRRDVRCARCSAARTAPISRKLLLGRAQASRPRPGRIGCRARCSRGSGRRSSRSRARTARGARRTGAARTAAIFRRISSFALLALRRQDEEAERGEDRRHDDAGHIGGGGRRGDRHDARRARRAPALTAAAAATAFRAPSASSLRLLAAGRRSRRRAATRGRPTSMSRVAIVVEAARVVVADDAVAVLAAALGEVLGDGLPLPQVRVDQPVDQLADLALDLLRRVGDDLLLEPLLHPAAVEQVHDPADAHRVVEELVAALLHLEEDAVDVGHPQLEVAQSGPADTSRAAARRRRAWRSRP